MSIEAPRRHREGRRVVGWSRSDGGSMPTLLVVHENHGSWSFHGLDAPGVKVSKTDATALAQGIVEAAE